MIALINFLYTFTYSHFITMYVNILSGSFPKWLECSPTARKPGLVAIEK